MSAQLFVRSSYSMGTTWLEPAGLEFGVSDTWDIYIHAWYWAMATISTIGYGDIVANHHGERFIAIWTMFAGGTMYAFITGSVCGIISNMNQVVTPQRGASCSMACRATSSDTSSDAMLCLKGALHHVKL